MERNFEKFVVALNISSLSTDVLQQITLILKQQTNQSLSSFVSQEYQSLVILEHKIWQILSLKSHEWFNQPCYSEFFQTLASFNKNLIFNQDNIKDDTKVSLLIPETIDQINSIFQRIEQNINDNDLSFTFVSLWFDNLSFFVHEYPQFSKLSIMIHINQCFGHHFVMSEQFKSYLIQLRQSQITQSVFTAKQLFYMKTCPFSLNVYLYSDPRNFDFTSDQVVRNIGDDYLQIIQVQSYTVELWSKELLVCIAHLIGFMRILLWWDGGKGTKLKTLFPTEKILCEYIEAMVRIINHKTFYKYITTEWFNDETILMDSALLSLMNIVQSQNINWFFRSMRQLPDILLKLTELSSAYYTIYLCAYGILSEILTDENLKELKITDSKRISFFDMLEQAWHDPLKEYKQISIDYFLKGFLNLSKNDAIQRGAAELNRISLFIEMCDQYPIAFDIIWGLSFNPDIQQQLRASSSFMSKLAHLAKECDNEQMRKNIHGILWNLEINHEDHSTSEINNEKTFDIMISYSHKEKILCQQLYQKLTKAGYRVWIDFDQMHGNVMDAMAQAIERSQTVIICMSEQYRRSNYCRAEAHYAFQRQRKIVPVLLQEHYRPDGWLQFLMGHLLYVDFNKHEFDRATEMLFKEIKTEDSSESNVSPVQPKEDADTIASTTPVSIPKASPLPTVSQNILEWTETQVQQWLVEHNLIQMSHLLVNCDGRSLVYLNKYMKHGQSQLALNLLQEDSLRRTKQNISLIELSCFHSLMDQQKRLLKSTGTNTNTEKKDI